MLIYKQELLSHTFFKEVMLPYETEEEAVQAILKVDVQNGVPYMWYEHKEDKELTPFLLLAIGTGHDEYKKLTKNQYIGSVILHNDSLVLHYFLISYPNEQ